MIETLFGSTTPMWTTLPPSGFGFQGPFALGNGAIGPPVFGSPNLAGPTNVGSAPAQPLPGPAGVQTTAYGYGPGLIAISPQNLGVAPFPRSTPLLAGAEPLVGLTPQSLIAAVAMRRGQPQGPTNDQEIEDFIYDALELLTGTSDVEVRCEGGRATLTGSVQHKRIKRDVGEIVWALPILHDVQNNLVIASRRRSRGGVREGEVAHSAPTRKQN